MSEKSVKDLIAEMDAIEEAMPGIASPNQPNTSSSTQEPDLTTINAKLDQILKLLQR